MWITQTGCMLQSPLLIYYKIFHEHFFPNYHIQIHTYLFSQTTQKTVSNNALSLSLFKEWSLCIHFYKQCYLITITLVYHPYLPVVKYPSTLVVLCTYILQFVNIIVRLFLINCRLVITLLLPYILFMDVVNNISSLISYFNSSPVSF